MATTVRLLSHQANLVQAPYVFPDIRFFGLVAGYASGKTSGLVYCIFNAVKTLLGKKDKEGHNPKIMVGSKNLTFMKKTLTGLMEQTLKETNSDYKYDKAHNIITIGNVELLLIPIEDESSIYGYCFEGNTLITTDKGEVPIKDIKVGDKVLTTKGFKRVKRSGCTGVKDCIKVTVDDKEIICTPEHHFIDVFNNNIKAKDLTQNTPLVALSNVNLSCLQGSLENELKQLQQYVNKNDIQGRTQNLKLANITDKTEDTIGQYEVYDIEVEECHEFFANGIRVHNSVTLVVIDELDELDTQTAMAVVKSSNDRCRQQIVGWRSPAFIFCTSSQGLKGTYQTVMHFKKSGIGYVLMRARTKDNIYLPKDYVESMYSIYNEKETACLLEGQFVSIDSGLVFPDYDPVKNKLDSDLYEYARDEELKIYIGQDFNAGFHNAVAFTVINKSIVAIKDYEFPDIRRAPEVFRYDFPTNEIIWIPDMTYKEHFSEFKKELRTFNVKIAYRSCNPLVADRNFACNKLFTAEHLFVCPMCKSLEDTLLTWQKNPKTGEPNKGGKGSPDHKGDCLGYVVHYLLSWHRDLKSLYDVTLRYIYDKRRARGADATELEVYSQNISADKLKTITLQSAPNVDKNEFNS